MNIRRTILLSIHSLFRQKTRSILTMLAISIGIAAVIAIMAAGRGMERLILGQLDSFGADTLNIEVRVPNGKAGGAQGGPGSVGIVITTLKDKDIETILRHPNISAAYGMVMGQEAVSAAGEIKKTMLLGHGAMMAQIDAITLETGRFYTPSEEDGLASVAVLGSSARQKLFGSDTPVGQTIYIRGKPFRVLGSLAPRGSAFFFDMDDVIILPAKTMQKKILGIDYVSAIIAKMHNAQKSVATKTDLTAVIRENHGIEDERRDDFAITTMEEARSTVGTITGGITILLVALVCLSLIVGGVGIMNIMYVSVAERTFEIGLRKSLGARRRDILLQFLTEAILITFGGGVAGIIGGIVIAWGVYVLATAANLKWVFSISLFSVALAVLFSLAIGLVFGLYPAKRAAGLTPLAALRKE